jgi:hypothetical protein
VPVYWVVDVLEQVFPLHLFAQPAVDNESPAVTSARAREALVRMRFMVSSSEFYGSDGATVSRDGARAGAQSLAPTKENNASAAIHRMGRGTSDMSCSRTG